MEKEDLQKIVWDAVAKAGGERGRVIIKVTTKDGESFYGTFMMFSGLGPPGVRDTLHIHLWENCNSHEKGFVIEEEIDNVTIMSNSEIVRVLNLSSGSIGKAEKMGDKHAIKKGTLDKEWWKKQCELNPIS
ncbi:MAG: hypothetical protein PHX25_04090 [Candidatus Pacebacteria bacterium]|nr:hypothetical protein [Candidatus Paceibacterota bacterium]